MGSTPGLGRYSGGRQGNLLQYSCLENPMENGAWQATVHAVTKSRTRMSNWTHTHTHTRKDLCVQIAQLIHKKKYHRKVYSRGSKILIGELWKGYMRVHQTILVTFLKKVKCCQPCTTLCDATDCSLPGFSVHGNLQGRILEWVVIPFSRESSQPRYWTQVSCTAGSIFTVWATVESKHCGKPPGKHCDFASIS